MPKVSVIMPVYNGEKYLREAVDSILSQTLADFELIIIDDGSTDKTAEIVNSYQDARVIYIKNENNLGISRSLNRGLELAQGEYIARMDADDISLPTRLEKQIDYMERHPQIVVCGTRLSLFGAQNMNWYTSELHKELKVDLLFSCCLAHPTIMFKCDAVKSGEVRYDTNFNGMEDYELWTRLIKKHRFGCVPEILFKYRTHSKQVTQNHNDNYIKKMALIKERQLAALDLRLDNVQFESFLNYCVFGVENCNIDALLQALMNIVNANKKCRLYNRYLLLNSVNAIVMRALSTKTEKMRFVFKNLKCYLSIGNLIDCFGEF